MAERPWREAVGEFNGARKHDISARRLACESGAGAGAEGCAATNYINTLSSSHEIEGASLGTFGRGASRQLELK